MGVNGTEGVRMDLVDQSESPLMEPEGQSLVRSLQTRIVEERGTLALRKEER